MLRSLKSIFTRKKKHGRRKSRYKKEYEGTKSHCRADSDYEEDKLRQPSHRPRWLSGFSPKPHGHRHPQLFDEIHSSKVQRYHPRDLADVLCANAERLDHSQLSTAALLLLRDPVPDCNTEKEVLDLMQQWALVFDEMFFLGKVTPHLKIIVENKPDEEHDGITTGNGKGIKINIAHSDTYVGRIEEEIISTLLHEMTHSFLGLYICKRASCCGKKMSTNPDWYLKGTGHGAIWASPMTYIEKALQKWVDWKVDCEIRAAVSMEMTCESWQPSGDQLREWGLEGMVGPTSDGQMLSLNKMKWQNDNHEGEDKSEDEEYEEYEDSEDSQDSESDEHVEESD